MINWHLTYRDTDVSTYSDGHGAYTVITHSRGICNEKITPPLAMKKDRERFNDKYHLSQYPQLQYAQSQQKTTPRVQQTYRGIKRAYRERL